VYTGNNVYSHSNIQAQDAGLIAWGYTLFGYSGSYIKRLDFWIYEAGIFPPERISLKEVFYGR
jgi:hypothetical protein